MPWRRRWEIGAGACYGEAADRQRDRANGGIHAHHTLRVFSCARWSPSSGGGGGRSRGAGAATGRLLIDSAIARTEVSRVGHTLRVFSCTRGSMSADGRYRGAGPSGRCNTSIKSFGWGCKSQSLRGRSLSCRATLLSWACEYTDRSVPFGKYCRSRPLVFSLNHAGLGRRLPETMREIDEGLG